MQQSIEVSGRTYTGTPRQIVWHMQHEGFNMRGDGVSLAEYIGFMRANLRRCFGIDIPVSEGNEADMAGDFVRGILAEGLATAH